MSDTIGRTATGVAPAARKAWVIRAGRAPLPVAFALILSTTPPAQAMTAATMVDERLCGIGIDTDSQGAVWTELGYAPGT